MLPCATPGSEKGLLPSGPRHNLGLESGCHPGQQVPPELLARDQAQNKPRQSGQARSWGRKYPFPHPGICLPQRPGPLGGAGPQSCSLTKGFFLHSEFCWVSDWSPVCPQSPSFGHCLYTEQVQVGSDPHSRGSHVRKGRCLCPVLWFGVLCAVPSPSHLSLSPQPGLRLHETSPWRSHPGLHSGSRREVSLACLPAPHIWVTLLTSSPSLPSAGTVFGAALVASLQ